MAFAYFVTSLSDSVKVLKDSKVNYVQTKREVKQKQTNGIKYHTKDDTTNKDNRLKNLKR